MKITLNTEELKQLIRVQKEIGQETEKSVDTKTLMAHLSINLNTKLEKVLKEIKNEYSSSSSRKS